jgi:hypothetical protein
MIILGISGIYSNSRRWLKHRSDRQLAHRIGNSHTGVMAGFPPQHAFVTYL